MALSENIKSKMEARRHEFPTTQALLLPLLHEIQREQGWISLQAQKDAAEFLNISLAKVREVVSFYTMYNQKPVGNVHLQVCVNISCWLSGSAKVMNCLEKKLGIGHGETTADGKYTLTGVECLASCGTGPVVQVNDEYHENMNDEKVLNLLDMIDADLASGKKDIGRFYQMEDDRG
jgi:NADH-quinone oxidoreductase subunit E